MKKLVSLSLLLTACGASPERVVIYKTIINGQETGDSSSGTGTGTGKGTGGTGNGVEDSIDGDSKQEGGVSDPIAPGSNKSAVYEAETAFSAGTAKLATNLAGFTGKGYASALKASGDKIIFTLQSASLASTTLTVRYASASAKKASVLVNGMKTVVLDLPASPAFKVATAEINVRAGLNTISLVNEDGSSGEVSIDNIEIKNSSERANRGASLPFLSYEAEEGMTNGTAVGPSRELFDFATSASGRKAVTLNATGKYVEWENKAVANAVVVRYSMPDSADGKGTKGTLSLYVNGKKIKSLDLSSKFAWLYGNYSAPNGFGIEPSQGSPHRAFDDSRFLLDQDIPVGAKVRLQKDASDTAPSFTIDLVELEQAPAPYKQPAGSLSVVDFGAKADDGVDDSEALTKAFAAGKAQNKIVWLPAGVFQFNKQMEVDHLTLRGAGPWYSVLQGTEFKGGFHGTGDEVRLFDFAILGESTSRKDGESHAALDGKLGKNSMMQNLWIEHTKVGAWTENPTEGFYMVGNRVRNTWADGVNFYSGTNNSAAENNHFRGTGDDSMAMWPDKESTDNNRFNWNTISLPDLASGIAVYGGSSNQASDNMIFDTREAAAGMMIGTHYDHTAPFAGTSLFERNSLVRTGGYERNYKSAFGALFIWAEKTDMTSDIQFRDIDIIDSNYQGVLISYNKKIQNMSFERVNVKGATTTGWEVNVSGSITVKDCKIEGVKTPTLLPQNGFTVEGSFL